METISKRVIEHKSNWASDYKKDPPLKSGESLLTYYLTLLRLSGFLFPGAGCAGLLVFITRLLFAGLGIVIIIAAAALVVLVVCHENVPHLDLQKRFATAVAANLRSKNFNGTFLFLMPWCTTKI